MRMLKPLLPMFIVAIAAYAVGGMAAFAPAAISVLYVLSLFTTRKDCTLEKYGKKPGTCIVYKSKYMAAYANGFGKAGKIFVSKALCDNTGNDEFVSVLFHEMAHLEYNHPLRNALIAVGGGIILSLSIALDLSIYSFIANMAVIAVAYAGNVILSELAADEYSAKHTGPHIIKYLNRIEDRSLLAKMRIRRIEKICAISA